MATEIIEKILPFKITLTRRHGASPNIYYYFGLNGKVHRGSTKTDNPSEAKKRAIKIYHEVDSGKKKSGKAKFETVVRKFLDYKKNHVTPETVQGYAYRSEYLIEFFKGKDIEDIAKSDFYEYQAWRENYHEIKKKKRKDKRILTAGNATINRDLGLLVSILIFAKEELSLVTNLKVPKWKALPEKKRSEILSSEEIGKLKQYWLQKNPFYWDIMNFILNTGLRYPSEINSLKWKNVFLEQRGMYIKRKSRLADKDKMFPVQIYDEAFEILTRLKSRNVPTGPEDYVFVDSKGMQIRNIKKSFKNSLRECGIEKLFPMFSFRHQFATEMMARGVPPKALSDQMGHKTMRMIDETYTHLMREHHASIAERIGVDKDKKPEGTKDEQLPWIFAEDFEKPISDLDFLNLSIHFLEQSIEGSKDKTQSTLKELFHKKSKIQNQANEKVDLIKDEKKD